MKLISLICLPIVIFLSGCNASLTHTNTVTEHSQVPVLNKPDRPQLEPMTADEVKEFKTLSPALQTKLLMNDKAVKIWADQLDVTIKDYNSYATQHNVLANQWVESLDKKGK